MNDRISNEQLNNLFLWRLRQFPKFLDSQRIIHGAKFGSRLARCLTMHGELRATLFQQRRRYVKPIELGLLSCRSVTDAGVAYLVDAFQGINSAEPENFNYHDAGTGTTAEAVGQTALVTPWGGARVTGTVTEPAANQYRTTGTITFNNTFAITEHGLFSASSTGTMWDRSVFTAINVVNTDQIAFQYTLTVNSGG